VFAAFVVGGMIAGSVATLSPLLLAFLLFAVPALAPIAVQFLMRGGAMYFAMSVMTVLYGLAMTAVARHINLTLRKSMTLSERNSQLIRVLTEAKAHAEVLNVNLQDEVAERREHEQALRDGEALLAEAQRMAHLGSWSYHPFTRRAVLSDETYRIYGIERGAAVPSCRAMIARVHRDDRRRVYALFERAARFGEPYETEFRISGADGKPRWVHVLGQPRIDSEGRTYEIRGRWSTSRSASRRTTSSTPNATCSRRLREGRRSPRCSIRCARCCRHKARPMPRSISLPQTTRWWKRPVRACRPNIASIPRVFRWDRIPACTRARATRDMPCWRATSPPIPDGPSIARLRCARVCAHAGRCRFWVRPSRCSACWLRILPSYASPPRTSSN
jgi:PAS domain-containing protein